MSVKLKREKIAKVTFDATGGKAIGSYETNLVVPKGAIITDCFYDVTTTFTTASNDAGTIALTTGQNVTGGVMDIYVKYVY